MEKFRHEKRLKEGLFDRAQLRQDDLCGVFMLGNEGIDMDKRTARFCGTNYPPGRLKKHAAHRLKMDLGMVFSGPALCLSSGKCEVF
jgi:hypothetical protein